MHSKKIVLSFIFSLITLDTIWANRGKSFGTPSPQSFLYLKKNFVDELNNYLQKTNKQGFPVAWSKINAGLYYFPQSNFDFTGLHSDLVDVCEAIVYKQEGSFHFLITADIKQVDSLENLEVEGKVKVIRHFRLYHHLKNLSLWLQIGDRIFPLRTENLIYPHELRHFYFHDSQVLVVPEADQEETALNLIDLTNNAIEPYLYPNAHGKVQLTNKGFLYIQVHPSQKVSLNLINFKTKELTIQQLDFIEPKDILKNKIKNLVLSKNGLMYIGPSQVHLVKSGPATNAKTAFQLSQVTLPNNGDVSVGPRNTIFWTQKRIEGHSMARYLGFDGEWRPFQRGLKSRNSLNIQKLVDAQDIKNVKTLNDFKDLKKNILTGQYKERIYFPGMFKEVSGKILHARTGWVHIVGREGVHGDDIMQEFASQIVLLDPLNFRFREEFSPVQLVSSSYPKLNPVFKDFNIYRYPYQAILDVYVMGQNSDLEKSKDAKSELLNPWTPFTSAFRHKENIMYIPDLLNTNRVETIGDQLRNFLNMFFENAGEAEDSFIKSKEMIIVTYSSHKNWNDALDEFSDKGRSFREFVEVLAIPELKGVEKDRAVQKKIQMLLRKKGMQMPLSLLANIQKIAKKMRPAWQEPGRSEQFMADLITYVLGKEGNAVKLDKGHLHSFLKDRGEVSIFLSKDHLRKTLLESSPLLNWPIERLVKMGQKQSEEIQFSGDDLTCAYFDGHQGRGQIELVENFSKNLEVPLVVIDLEEHPEQLTDDNDQAKLMALSGRPFVLFIKGLSEASYDVQKSLAKLVDSKKLKMKDNDRSLGLGGEEESYINFSQAMVVATGDFSKKDSRLWCKELPRGRPLNHIEKNSVKESFHKSYVEAYPDSEKSDPQKGKAKFLAELWSCMSDNFCVIPPWDLRYANVNSKDFTELVKAQIHMAEQTILKEQYESINLYFSESYWEQLINDMAKLENNILASHQRAQKRLLKDIARALRQRNLKPGKKKNNIFFQTSAEIYLDVTRSDEGNVWALSKSGRVRIDVKEDHK